MREILFRGKFGNEWKYGFLSIEPKGLVIKEPYKNESSNVWHIDADTVGQYTGYTDMNGKKIFEGDIVAFNYTADELTNCEILWFKNKWVVRERVHYAINDIDSFFCGRSTVIGNIYDNPELLKGENNDKL
nr:MAG TPA: YopX protein [Bacteriophage sp.]